MTAYTPNLPALITALPGDHTRAPQTEFDRARQVLFIENLSITGSVRSAASAAQVSHQTAYRARRATAAFRTAWDAALVVARAAAADTLAARAIDGVEEKVYYHGEEVATRTRYSDRLLLAHLARLDRLVENPAANAFAEDWDESVARFERGEAQPAPEPQTPPAAPQKNSPGPCNTRSMSYTPEEARAAGDEVDWDDPFDADYYLERVGAGMDATRPANAPRMTGDETIDPGGVTEDAQFSAFLAGVPDWWRVIAPAPFGAKAEGRWFYRGEEDEADRALEQGTGEAAPQ